MKILVLIGKSNSGKTSSIKHLILKLLAQDGIEVVYTSRFFSSDPEQLSKNIKDNWKTDRNHIRDMTVLLKHQGEKIGITTYGDSLKEILSALKTIEKRFGGCDMFVCGRHKNNKFENEFAEYKVNNFYYVEKVRASSMDDFDNANKTTGNELFEKILGIL